MSVLDATTCVVAWNIVDEDDRQLRRFLRRDPHYSPASRWAMIAAFLVTFFLCIWLTQPWPRRGPGGGHGTNWWGFPVATVISVAVFLTLAKILRRTQR